MDVHFWSVLSTKKFGFCAAKLLEIPHDISLTLLALYTGGIGLIELLPTKGVADVGE